jgi:hypothetical protein
MRPGKPVVVGWDRQDRYLVAFVPQPGPYDEAVIVIPRTGFVGPVLPLGSILVQGEPDEWWEMGRAADEAVALSTDTYGFGFG